MTDLVRTIIEWFIEAPAIVWIIEAVIAVAALAGAPVTLDVAPVVPRVPSPCGSSFLLAISLAVLLLSPAS